MEEEIEFNDQFMNDLFKFLQSKNVKGLLGKRSGDVIILFSDSSLEKRHLEKESFCKQLMDYCTGKYPHFSFEMGVSSSYSSLEDAPQLYEESVASLKLANSNQKLVYFDSLGVVGMLLQTKNLETIERYAYKILGRLIEEDKNSGINKHTLSLFRKWLQCSSNSSLYELFSQRLTLPIRKD